MGKLFIIPTPIGNLKDITLRALETLKEVDFILCEDKRTTNNLLKHYNISKPLKSYHKFNEHKKIKPLIQDILGKKVALVSDAGMPGICDAAYLLVKSCFEHQIEVITLPGPTAFLPALINSGLPFDRFYFHGFLPHKKGRLASLNELASKNTTAVLYESPHRLMKTLQQLKEVFGGEHRISVSREISKIYEETIRGTIDEVIEHFLNKSIKGEFVIVIDAKKI